MPENLGYQFNRLYPAPIETNRQVNTISDRNAIPMSIRWEGMFVYVIGESTTFELVGGTDNTKWQVKEGLSDAPQDGDIYGRKDGEWEVISSGGGGEPYLVYTALISQSGTNDPTVVVLRNTLGGSITWARSSEGLYIATNSISGFTVNKTIVFINEGGYSSVDSTTINWVRLSDTQIRLRSVRGGAVKDGLLNIASFEIRVYT